MSKKLKADATVTTAEIACHQWLAGVIDGDGYNAIPTSNNVAVCEITMPLFESLLWFNQNLQGL